MTACESCVIISTTTLPADPLTCVNVCSDVMKLGFSKPWPEAMTMITGQPKMTAQPLMQYFDPLIKWLEAENKKNGDDLGWPEYDWKPTTNGVSNTFIHL